MRLLGDIAVKYLIFIALFWLPLSNTWAQIQNYKVDPGQCSLTFDVSAQVHRVQGVGKEFSGTISGDPRDITTAKIIIRLDPTGFNTQNEKRDKVMREKSLEVEKYPYIEFESTSIEAEDKELDLNGPTDATVLGKLALHGVEKDVRVPVRIFWDEKHLSADAEMDLKLDEFNVFRPKVLFFRLQNDVKVRFRIVAARQPD